MEQQRPEKLPARGPEGLTGLAPTGTAAAAADQVKQQGQQVVHKAQQAAISKVEDGKRVAADQVARVGKAVRTAGESLHRDGAEPLGNLASAAAEQIDKLAGYLRRSDARGLARDAQEFVRSKPAVVFGAAVVTGLLIGRFLRSSERSSVSSRGVDFEPAHKSAGDGLGLAHGSSPDGFSPGGASREQSPPARGGWA